MSHSTTPKMRRQTFSLKKDKSFGKRITTALGKRTKTGGKADDMLSGSAPSISNVNGEGRGGGRVLGASNNNNSSLPSSPLASSSPAMQRLVPQSVEEAPQLYVKVIAGRGFASDFSGFVYCALKLDSVVIQTNYVRSEATPKWEEEFAFLVHNKMSCIEIAVYEVDEEGLETKFLGEVNVGIYTIGSYRLCFEWFPLQSSRGSSASGELQLQFYNSAQKSSMDAMRDLEEIWSGFLGALKSAPLSLMASIFDCVDASDADRVANSVVTIFTYLERELQLFLWVIEKEVAATTSTSVLFRSNSMAVRLCSVYGKMVSRDWLRATILPLMQEAMQDPTRYEVDTRRVNLSATQHKKNQVALIEMVNKFVSAIVSRPDKVPAAILNICNMFRSVVQRKFPNFVTRALGGFFFLRLVCPAIVAPTSFRILEKHPSGPPHRALVLIAKVLQNAANHTQFKEPNMQTLNPHLDSIRERIDGFLLQLADQGSQVESKGESLWALRPATVTDTCITLAKLLRSYIPKVELDSEETETTTSEEGGFGELLHELQELEANDTVHEKPYSPALIGPEFLDVGVAKISSSEAPAALLLSDDANTINTSRVWKRPCKPGAARELLKRLLAIYLALCEQAGKNKSLDWKGAVETEQFRQWEESACELQLADIAQMVSRRRRTSFWLNVYNLMMLHLHFLVGPPSTAYARKIFYNNYQYRVGPYVVSLNDIENGILRGNPPLKGKERQFDASDNRRALVLPLDIRVHFAVARDLTTQSSPIRAFSSVSLDSALRGATQMYLNAHVSVDAVKKEVTLPKMFQRYKTDFASALGGGKDDFQYNMLNWIWQYLTARKKMDAFYLLGHGYSLLYQRRGGKSKAPRAEVELYAKLDDEPVEDEELPAIFSASAAVPSKKGRNNSAAAAGGAQTAMSSLPPAQPYSPVTSNPASPLVSNKRREQSPRDFAFTPPHSTGSLPSVEKDDGSSDTSEKASIPAASSSSRPRPQLQRQKSYLDRSILQASMGGMSQKAVSELYDSEVLAQEVYQEVSKTLSVTMAFNTGKMIRQVKLDLLQFQGVKWTAKSLEKFKAEHQLEAPQMTQLQRQVVSEQKQKQLLKLLVAINTAVGDICFLLENIAKEVQQQPERDILDISRVSLACKQRLGEVLEQIREKNSETKELERVVTLENAVRPEVEKIVKILGRTQRQLEQLDFSNEEGQTTLLKFAYILTYIKQQLASPKALPPFEGKEWKASQVNDMTEEKFHQIMEVLQTLIGQVIAKLNKLQRRLKKQRQVNELLECALIVRNIREALYAEI